MKINWKVRLKNPYFWVGIIGVVLTASGTAPDAMTSWQAVIDWGKALIENPFALGGVILAILGTIHDPTTTGLGDSGQALTYSKPKDKFEELEGTYTDDRRDAEDE